MNEEMNEKAEYCLNCKNKPCSIKGCPINTQIPEFINEIKNNNLEKAVDILHENNVMSHICSIVCPQENQCEGSCIRGIKGEPTEIGKLERFVNEWAKENKYEYKVNLKEKNGKKVAIIGSGPAGLQCAYELLKEGFLVDIYEKENILGGVLMYGIPDFRLSKDLVNEVIDRLKKLGATFFTNKELGKDFSLEEIGSKYDYVFLGIGANKSSVYKLSEDEIYGVYESNYFLKMYYEKDYIKDLGTAIIIGGGNVAMDSARTALRMGAKKVKILYRRDRIHMPALERELDDALKEGIEFHELTRVISANTIDGKIKSLKCIRTQIIDGKAVDIEGDFFEEEADSVVFAIGLKPDNDLIQNQGLEIDDWGYIKVDENGKTNIENVYAGGDVIDSNATVCWALAAGKRAARGIIGTK